MVQEDAVLDAAEARTQRAARGNTADAARHRRAAARGAGMAPGWPVETGADPPPDNLMQAPTRRVRQHRLPCAPLPGGCAIHCAGPAAAMPP
jgi:hypothetical protein